MLDWERAPAAPLDVVAWLDERQRVWESQSEFWRPPVRWPEQTKQRAATNEEHVRVRVELHRVVGPEALDAELRSLRPLVRDCYEHDRLGEVRAERIKLMLLERKTAPLLVIATEPRDAPFALVACVGDVLTHEILRPLGANGPMVVTVFATTVDNAQTTGGASERGRMSP